MTEPDPAAAQQKKPSETEDFLRVAASVVKRVLRLY